MRARICLVGYTYRAYEMEYAFQRAKKYGFDAIELRNFSDMDSQNIFSLRKSVEKAQRLGLRYDVEAPAIFLPLGEVCSEKDIIELLPFLAENNVSIIHTRIDSLNSRKLVSAEAYEEDYRKAANMLKKVGDIAEENNVTVAIETHMGTIHDTSSSIMRLLRYVDRRTIKASLDFANLLITNRRENLLETIRKLAGKVGYVHIKNVKFYPWGYDWNIPVQFGEINYFKALKGLIDSGYSGLFATEYCGDGDPDVYARMDGKYLRSLLNRLTQPYSTSR